MIGSLARKVAMGTWAGELNSPLQSALTVSAAGTSSQANSTAIAAGTELVKVTTAAANSGVRLAVPGGVNDMVVVINAGANACLLFPATGGTINGLAANASISIAVGKVAFCMAINATDWVVNVSA
jgi:hypothetical protein